MEGTLVAVQYTPTESPIATEQASIVMCCGWCMEKQVGINVKSTIAGLHRS